MKRLLSLGIGPIFQLCRSFRNKELGCYHNPEFTILEWYRPNFNICDIMNEINDLLKLILNCNDAEKISYQKIFIKYTKIDPLSINKKRLFYILKKLNINYSYSSLEENLDDILQLLFLNKIEPNIGHNKPLFIYEFPSSQASLAKINSLDNRVADRFELYFKGIELANGFNELTNADEQRKRFLKDNNKRLIMKLKQQPIDKNLLFALKKGIPECSGVALGIDRLIMLALNAKNINEVIAFPFANS